MMCDTRYRVDFVSDLWAASLLVFRLGFLLRRGSTRRVVLLDNEERFIESRGAEWRTDSRRRPDIFPCHLTRIREHVDHNAREVKWLPMSALEVGL